MPPQPATITSPPPPLLNPSPVLHDRQNIVTLSVTETPTPATKHSNDDAQFPFAVAIPALVGGMALAVLAALLYLYCLKRKKRKRRDAYEARRRRANRRAKEAAAKSGASSRKTSPTASRSTSSTALYTPTSEKSFDTPAVPALPKDAHTSPPKNEKQSYKPASPPHTEKYSTQPTIESAPTTDSDKSQTPSKSSRSAARVAVADRAAASAFGDPNTRHQPRKPSPLAVKAQEKSAAVDNAPKWGDGPFRREQNHEPSPFNDVNAIQDTSFEYDAYDERPASPTSDYDRAQSGDWSGGRQVSGEWGVALGSPAHDESFQAQQGKGRYSGDPYLNVSGQQQPRGGNVRGKSGVYGTDPYEAYHDAEELEHEYDEVKKQAPAPSGRWNLGMKGWL